MTTFWAGPRVRCIGRSKLDLGAIADTLDDWDTEWVGTLEHEPGTTSYDSVPFCSKPDAALLTEFAGRVCYLSFGSRQSRRTTDEYVLNLLKQGHGSVLEHASWSLLIQGVSRSLTHELIRHRVGVAISQLSQRYVDDPALLEFVMPPLVADEVVDESPLGQAFRNQCQVAVLAYQSAREDFANAVAVDYPNATKHERKKMAAEAARAYLPNATATTLVWTINARALRNFLHKRGQMGVELEMRRFACTLARWLIFDEGLALFPDLRIEDGPDGREMIVLQYAPI